MRAFTCQILLSFLFLLFNNTSIKAQSDTDFVSKRALLFADSLIKSFHNSNFADYLNISYPGVVKYYGGKHRFTEYVRQERTLREYFGEQLELTQLINEKQEWQCVMKKINEQVINGKNAMVISYLVGQSKDEGKTWKYIDVAYNPVSNIREIMPDIFDNINIPGRQIIFQ